MSSTLTFQLRQQQDRLSASRKGSGSSNNNDSLPSPPNSSYGDEAAMVKETSEADRTSSGVSSSQSLDNNHHEDDHALRRDSLPTHFNALTLQHYSSSLPENYTIDHSAPIPIIRKPASRAHEALFHSHQQQHHHHHHHYHLSPTAVAAATGGRTLRTSGSSSSMRRSAAEPSSSSVPLSTSHGRGSKGQRHMSESLNNNGKPYHRCEQCGKVYKHPNCLAKHRWEHSDQWELTSKLLLTKHQQVQMLEAAAILVSMDTKRFELEQQKEREMQLQRQQMQRQEEMQRHKEEEEDDDDDTVSIHIDDDDDDDVMGMEMEAPAPSSPVISIGSTTSSPSLLPASFPHGDD